ncbi:outer membrane receptor FepA [Salmonella enterica subsp. enterica]|uniref:Outer membrane receptor FepA n=1 Tax=Salmonella enterica I TaxID=59201 RepID=A0A447PIY4_SALET|nr:outer membrane receptor FepA [Salmonella enterica subsp. enterica]
MNKKIHSLTLLVNLGIYGAALPVMAEEKTDSAALTNEDTIVVTAAQQNLQAPGVSTITADEIRKKSARARRVRNHPHHARRKPDRQLHQRSARE